MATPPFKFGSSHVDFQTKYLVQLQEPWEFILDDELADEGIETDTHCTVRYGLEEFSYGQFLQLYNDVEVFDGPFELQVSGIGVFDTDDGDCIKWEIEPAEWLLNLRSLIERDFDCAASKFPTYQPHITIAYVKSGTGKEIIDRISSEISTNFSVTVDNLILANKNGKRYVIPLNRAKRLAEESILRMFNAVL